MTALVQRLNTLRLGGWTIDWVLAIVVAIPLLVLAFDPENFASFVGFAARALLNTSLYIAIAVGLLAYLKATGAETLVAKAFTGSPTRMILLAALVGGLAPFCSCEVIPFISGLLALGAPVPAVMAFWLSSPVMDPVQFTITAGALGVEYAVAKAIAAVTIGLAGGFALLALTRAGAFADPLRLKPKKRCGCGPSPFSGKPVWSFWREEPRRAEFAEVAQSQAIFLLRWLSLAYVLEAALVHYVPASAIASLVGGEGVTPILIAAAVGMPAYLNGAVAPAMVSGLVEQGMQPGAALSFLIAGAVSSIPAMAAVWALVKRELFAAYIGFGFAGAVLAGLAFQAWSA